MKVTYIIQCLFTLTRAATIKPSPALKDRTIQGIDISHYQANPNLTEAHTVGLSFIYIKATEGATYMDPKFSKHLAAASEARFLRGGYHVARPQLSSGTSQADFFVFNGGAWVRDNQTLPGLLSIGLDDDCTGMVVKDMVRWIRDFVGEYKRATGREPVIGTRNAWWVECTGNTAEFSESNPLFLAKWGESVGSIPGRWRYATIWQYKEGGAWGGNSNIFSGDAEALRKLVQG